MLEKIDSTTIKPEPKMKVNEYIINVKKASWFIDNREMLNDKFSFMEFIITKSILLRSWDR